MTDATRPIGFWTAYAIVVANMIGVGVFSTLSFQVHALPSPFVILILWTLGGIVALCGALAYAELVAALPRSGGEYHLLGRLYGKPVGFVAGVISLTAGFAAPIAAAAIAFEAYLAKLTPAASTWPNVAASAAIVALAVLHGLRVELGARAQVAMTLLKLLLISGLILTGASHLADPAVSFAPQPGDAALVVSAAFAVSLIYVSYAYAGWNAAVYVASETVDVSRVLPKALLAGTATVTLLYLLVNAVFLAVVPMEQLLAVNPFSAGDQGLVEGELAVAFLAGHALFGAEGARVIGALVALGLLSTISAMVLAGPRVASTMAEDYPRALGCLQPIPGRAPVIAVALQAGLALLLLWTATFAQVIAYIGLLLSSCALLVAAGVIWLRIREPALARPFRCWGYPLTPAIFIAVDGWMIVHTAIAQPLSLAFSLATIALGLLGWWGLARAPGAESAPAR